MVRSQQTQKEKTARVRALAVNPVVSVQPTDIAADVDPGTVHHHLGFHMRRAQTAMKRGFLEATKNFNLTQSQFGILVLLQDNPGAPQSFVASELGTDRATVMAIVDRLEERDLLVRKRSKIDRRRQDMFLTSVGEAMIVQVMSAIDRHEQNYAARFSPAERALLIELLQRVYNQHEYEL